MTALFRSLLLLIAQKADSTLAKHIDYLKTENEILRGKLPKRITVTPQERRRLLTLGKPLRTAIRALISIVTH